MLNIQNIILVLPPYPTAPSYQTSPCHIPNRIISSSLSIQSLQNWYPSGLSKLNSLSLYLVPWCSGFVKQFHIAVLLSLSILAISLMLFTLFSKICGLLLFSKLFKGIYMDIQRTIITLKTMKYIIFDKIIKGNA